MVPHDTRQVGPPPPSTVTAIAAPAQRTLGLPARHAREPSATHTVSPFLFGLVYTGLFGDPFQAIPRTADVEISFSWRANSCSGPLNTEARQRMQRNYKHHIGRPQASLNYTQSRRKPSCQDPKNASKPLHVEQEP